VDVTLTLLCSNVSLNEHTLKQESFFVMFENDVCPLGPTVHLSCVCVCVCVCRAPPIGATARIAWLMQDSQGLNA